MLEDSYSGSSTFILNHCLHMEKQSLEATDIKDYFLYSTAMEWYLDLAVMLEAEERRKRREDEP